MNSAVSLPGSTESSDISDGGEEASNCEASGDALSDNSASGEGTPVRAPTPSTPPAKPIASVRNSWTEVPPRRDVSRKSFLTQNNREALAKLAAAGVHTSVSSDFDWTAGDGEGGGHGCSSPCWHRHNRARLKLWLFLEEPSSTVSLLLVFVIMTSIYFSINTEEHAVQGIGMAFNIIFCVDFLLRLWAFPLPLRFFKSPINMIDFLCILPFMIIQVLRLPRLIPILGYLSQYEAFLRLLKLVRYFWGWQLLFRAVSDSAKALIVPLFFLMIIVILGSCTLYIFESLTNDEFMDDTEIVRIRNLPDSIHFSVLCVLSMSTGPFYGMEAVAAPSRAIVCCLMFLGMLFMAMPIAIVGSCFTRTWIDKDRIVLLGHIRSRLLAQGFTPKDVRDVFDEVDEDGSGEIEFAEFKNMIRAFHMESLNHAKCWRLFQCFDTDRDGHVKFLDFAITLYPELMVEDRDAERPELVHQHSFSSKAGRGTQDFSRCSARNSCAESVNSSSEQACSPQMEHATPQPPQQQQPPPPDELPNSVWRVNSTHASTNSPPVTSVGETMVNVDSATTAASARLSTGSCAFSQVMSLDFSAIPESSHPNDSNSLRRCPTNPALPSEDVFEQRFSVRSDMSLRSSTLRVHDRELGLTAAARIEASIRRMEDNLERRFDRLNSTILQSGFQQPSFRTERTRFEHATSQQMSRRGSRQASRQGSRRASPVPLFRRSSTTM